MEGKNDFYLLGVMAGVAMGVLAWVLLKGKLRAGNKQDVDERQLLVRAKATQIGFFFCLAELGVLLVLEGMGSPLPLTHAALYTIALLLPIGVYAVYCIFHDAYLGLHANRRNFLVLGTALVVLELMNTLRVIRAGEMVAEGKLTSSCIHPLVGLLWLVILAALGIRERQNKGDGE